MPEKYYGFKLDEDTALKLDGLIKLSGKKKCDFFLSVVKILLENNSMILKDCLILDKNLKFEKKEGIIEEKE